ncbi:MAG: histidine kinase [Cyclobacteriaceae bacterium]
MKHPILNSSGYKFYIITWIIICIIHVFVLNFYYSFGLIASIVDSAVYNASFAFLSPGLWFLIRFNNGRKGDLLSLISAHVFASFLMIALWVSLCKLLLNMLMGYHDSYITFLNELSAGRAIVGLVFYVLSIMVFYLINYYQDLQNKSMKELELRALLREAELNMLKSQINPHFMFNSLNSIVALTDSFPEKAREMVIKLSEFLRYAIGKHNSEMNPLVEEIKNTVRYLEIEKVRFGEKLLFEVNIPKACEEVLVPNLILQPLFENAVKYGLYESLEPVNISLDCSNDTDFLQISISNNFDAEASMARKGEGIGLNHIRKRLSILYNRSDLLSTEQLENIFTVTLKIPLNKS